MDMIKDSNKFKNKSDLSIVVLILCSLSILLFSYQNCANSEYQNPSINENGLSAVCTPTDSCLKFMLNFSETTDDRTSTVCISTFDDVNGPSSKLNFAGGCTMISSSCASCNLNQNHSVSFQVSKEDSKVDSEQSITIYFTPNGGSNSIGN